MSGLTLEGDSIPVPAERVREQVARIAESAGFAGSQRLPRFLRYVVEQTLAKATEELKEYTVAMEVFDRGAGYDPSIDSIVRVEARRLRRKLQEYYEGPGRQDAVRIGLRPGSYVAVIAWGEERELAPPLRAGATTIAVLPFVNMSPEPDQEYFCDGITEEILNALASIPSLAVVARTSSFQFKGRAVDVREVGEKLGATLVVEGSVRKAGNQLRITAQAVDARNGYHLWSETYGRELSDVFAIQEEISRAVAGMVQARLPGDRGRHGGAQNPSLEAYRGYCKALHLVHQETVTAWQAAMEEFRALIAKYPDYADPYAGIATVYGALSIFGIVSGREVLPEMRKHAEAAVRLHPESSAAWMVMGGISAHWEFDWAEAERRFQRAIALQPSNYAAHSWYGGVLAMLGRFEEAEGEYKMAMKLNPLYPSAYARLGFLEYLRGNHGGAEEYLEQSLGMAPDYGEARFALGMVYLAQGRNEEAVEVLSRHLEEAPVPLHMGMLAGAYQRMGREAECRAIRGRLEEMAAEQYVTPMARVAACVLGGDREGAMEALEASIEDRSIFANVLNVDPFVDGLRSDGRFQALVRRMNLAPRGVR